MVTAVNFPDAGGATFAYTDGKITVASVPAAATEGNISLVMANGEGSKVAYTLVHPVISSVSPITLKAGEDITVSGSDLDLITVAKLGGKELVIKSVSPDGTTLVLTTLNTSVAGSIELGLANGETITDATHITLTYESLIIVNSMNESAHIGETVTMKGENFMLIENIYIGTTKVKNYAMRSDTEIKFVMPWMSAPATYSVYFDLYNGDRENCPKSIDVGLELETKTIWEGNMYIGNWNAGMQALAWGGYDWTTVKPGTIMNIYLTPDMCMVILRYVSEMALGPPSGTQIYSLDANISVLPLFLQAMLTNLTTKNGLYLAVHILPSPK